MLILMILSLKMKNVRQMLKWIDCWEVLQNDRWMVLGKQGYKVILNITPNVVSVIFLPSHT